MKINLILDLGVTIDEDNGQIIPMFAKEIEGGYAFFNWTAVESDKDSNMKFSWLGDLKVAAMCAIHTNDTKPKVITHHVRETCSRSVSEELEVLIGMLTLGDRVLFCIEGDMDSGSADFYKAMGYVVGRTDNVTPDLIGIKECGITGIDDPFLIINPSNNSENKF